MYNLFVPSRNKECAISRPKGGNGDCKGHEPRHGPQQPVAERDRYRLAVRHLADRHHRQI